MVQTASTMLPLGTKAPDFSLPDPSGKKVSLSDFADAPAVLVIFLCNHCPYVKHVAAGLAELAKEYQRRGVAVVGINSNDVDGFPDDSPAKMAEEVKSRGYTFPYLYDATQCVAKAYRAACTPDFYVFDRRPQAGLSRPDGLQPAAERRARDRRGPPRGARRRAGRPARLGQPEAQPRLQHQVEAGQRAGLLQVAIPFCDCSCRFFARMERQEPSIGPRQRHIVWRGAEERSATLRQQRKGIVAVNCVCYISHHAPGARAGKEAAHFFPDCFERLVVEVAKRERRDIARADLARRVNVEVVIAGAAAEHLGRFDMGEACHDGAAVPLAIILDVKIKDLLQLAAGKHG